MIAVFTMMPFDHRYDEVWDKIKTTVESVNDLAVEFKCFRMDDIKRPGNITAEMLQAIEKASICIADISGKNANVMYELGYAHALKKPVILLSQDEDRPFDVLTERTILYKPENLVDTLRNQLIESFREIVKIVGPAEEDFLFADPELERRIFVTGSSKIDDNIGQSRIKALLTPYLSSNTIWYVGSNGRVDELVVEFLCRKKQIVRIMGYFQFDFSSRMMDLIRKYHLSFINATKQQAVDLKDAPSHRDSYMKQTTDLSIYIWNGSSIKTKSMIDWSLKTNKDFIVSFADKGDSFY